jgi:hypothetical protein
MPGDRPSFWSTLETCVLTVGSDMTSAPPISVFDIPPQEPQHFSLALGQLRGVGVAVDGGWEPAGPLLEQLLGGRRGQLRVTGGDDPLRGQLNHGYLSVEEHPYRSRR